jgi:hypothetical protein
MFTHPDCRCVVDRPEGCMRIFPETEHANSRRDFSKRKTASASETEWFKFQQKNTEHEQIPVFRGETTSCQTAQELLVDIENSLKTINTS